MYFLSLHTADPKRYGFADTEIAYSGYRRIDLNAISVAYEATGVRNAEPILFAACEEDWDMPRKLTHYAISDSPSGPPREIMRSTNLDYPLFLSRGITPTFAQGALKVIFDSVTTDSRR